VRIELTQFDTTAGLTRHFSFRYWKQRLLAARRIRYNSLRADIRYMSTRCHVSRRLETETSETESATLGNTSKKLNVSHVIMFMYDELTTDEEKKIQTAKCKRCRAVIREKLGTTSAFVRHLSTAAHPCLRSE
jgi:hypothetical protein